MTKETKNIIALWKELEERELKYVGWYTNICYFYDCDGYNWIGVMIIYDKQKNNKNFGELYLWHCSCHWPCENWPIVWFTKEEIIKILEKKRDKKEYWRKSDISDEENEEIFQWFMNFINLF